MAVSRQVFIGLGSNLEQPLRQLQDALDALAQLPDTKLMGDSGYYTSRPMGPQDQPDYYNAVALIETSLAPLDLLDKLQMIEKQQGRVKQQHWGARTIDLDILLYGDQVIEHPRLSVPHRGICERDFVYQPLLRLAETVSIPGHGSLRKIVKTVASSHSNYGACYQGRIK